MAGYEVSHGDVVSAADGFVAETQVGLGYAAGLLGVVFKVCLCILVGVVADDLDGILVCANGTVGAQTPELAGDDALACGNDVFTNGQGQEGDIIFDAHGEVILLCAVHVVVNSLHLSGGGVLGSQTVTTCQNLAAEAVFDQCCANVQIQRFAQRAGFLGAVQNGDALCACGQSSHQMLHGEGTVQVNLDHTDLFALCVQVVHNFFQSFANGAHCNHNAVSIGCAVVVEQLIVATGDLVNFVHVAFYDFGQSVVCGVACFAVLEEGVAVLNGGTDGGVFGGQCVVAELLHCVPVQQLAQIFVVQNFDLLQFVRGAEAVEEVLEGDGALDCGQVRNSSHVHTFLNGCGCQLCPTGLAASHNVGVVTEDGNGVSTDGTCGNVHNAGEHGAADAEHRRYHQQQTLGCGVGGGERAGFQRAVHCTCCAGFSLHFYQLYGLTKQVFLAIGRPFIYVVRHRAGRSDGVDGSNFGERVGHVCSCFVAVHGFEDFVLRHNHDSSHNIFTRYTERKIHTERPQGDLKPFLQLIKLYSKLAEM